MNISVTRIMAYIIIVLIVLIKLHSTIPIHTRLSDYYSVLTERFGEKSISSYMAPTTHCHYANIYRIVNQDSKETMVIVPDPSKRMSDMINIISMMYNFRSILVIDHNMYEDISYTEYGGLIDICLSYVHIYLDNASIDSVMGLGLGCYGIINNNIKYMRDNISIVFVDPILISSQYTHCLCHYFGSIAKHSVRTSAKLTKYLCQCYHDENRILIMSSTCGKYDMALISYIRCFDISADMIKLTMSHRRTILDDKLLYTLSEFLQ